MRARRDAMIITVVGARGDVFKSLPAMRFVGTVRSGQRASAFEGTLTGTYLTKMSSRSYWRNRTMGLTGKISAGKRDGRQAPRVIV